MRRLIDAVSIRVTEMRAGALTQRNLFIRELERFSGSPAHPKYDSGRNVAELRISRRNPPDHRFEELSDLRVWEEKHDRLIFWGKLRELSIPSGRMADMRHMCLGITDAYLESLTLTDLAALVWFFENRTYTAEVLYRTDLNSVEDMIAWGHAAIRSGESVENQAIATIKENPSKKRYWW
jgi:hypothetical protein